MNQTTASDSWNPWGSFPSPREDLRPWLIMLLILGILKPFTLLIYGASQNIAIFTTSKVLFAQSLRCISGTTFRFYDITPVGRLMNRVTSDIKVVDSALDVLGGTIFSASGFVVSLFVIAFVSPTFMLLMIPLMAAFVLVFQQFLPASRNLKRLETVSLSPLYTIFGEVLAGITSVRAFRSQEFFYTRVIGIVDQFQALEHFFWSTQSWLVYR
jgi:ABC-type multidrug transport system fused ATPase/permease subunit